MDTARKITNLLNRKAATVTELAVALGISRNSAHLQVTKLETAGFIEKFLAENKSGVGKPAHHYRVKPGSEDAFSSAYKTIMVGMIEILGTELPETLRVNILEHTGKLLAKTAGLTPTGDVDADTQRAVEVVNSMGAIAEMQNQDDSVAINCHSCPVASLVHKDPLVCNLVAAYFAEATGNQATVQCQHGRTVICGFAVEKPDA
ncbi:MAG: hypothetical protein AAF564_26140 [Bacteroidota bacterium]